MTDAVIQPGPALSSSATAPQLSLQELGGENEGQNTTLLFGTLVGGALIANAYLASWTYEAHLPATEQTVTGLTGFIGALLLAAPVVRRAVAAVMAGERDLGELATLAIFACFAIGDYREAGLVAFLLMLAELLEDRTAQGARAAVERLVRLTPADARKLVNGREQDCLVAALQVGDVIRVRPGENIPVDGVINKGETTINQASVTGESLPVDGRHGSNVFAGTINLTGLIEVEVSRVGGDTALGKVRELILEAESTRLPIMRLIDRYVQWYTPTMVMIAAIIFYFTGDIKNAITALVVGCPCALVLATPTAMVAGLTCAARFGILIKNVAHLESASQINAVVFDKTGTLTTGQLTVQRLAPVAGVSAARFVKLAASADQHSNHPAARAMVRVALDARVALVDSADFQEIGGKGVRALIEDEEVLVGRRTWLEERGIDMSQVEVETLSHSEGYSYLYVAASGQCLGWAAMVDRPRPEAQQATADLRELGIARLTMLTGDRWGVARRVAAKLGCTDVVAECLPQQKLDLVENLKRQGLKVAVIGDGVNDAPALAAGDLSVAMGAAGNDIAIHSASIALMSDDISRLPLLIRLSRQVRGAVVQNLAFGLLLMIIGLILSGMGYLTPIIAAIFHNAGSIVVIFNSARLVRFGEDVVPIEA